MQITKKEKEQLEWLREHREEFESLLEHAPQISEEFEYRAAKELLWTSWRKVVIGAAGLLTAAIIIWNNGKQLFAWMVKGVL